MSTSVDSIAQRVVDVLISTLPKNKHLGILHEMYGFDGILNFSRTIKDLIAINQMSVFGISQEMQIILQHIAQVKLLSNMPSIRRKFQKAYENIHNRAIIVVKIGDEEDIDIDKVIAGVVSHFSDNYDIIYQKSQNLGIVVKFGNKVLEYTPNSIAKMLQTV
ncbi:MAG: hypothetical protein ACI9CD_000391 [Candidatus Deianiraeaceae bacterium]|jgi:hypothetical protein